jgi:predicted Zn-dependent peptidase
MDGPIKTGKIYKTLLMQNLSFNFSKQFEQKIKTISSKELNELAKKYYQIDTMHIVCIG